MDDVKIEASQLEEVLKILPKLKPKLKMSRHMEGGSGWVSESYFTFSQSGNYYWIVIIGDTGTFAFKEILPDWVKFYSNLVLLSQEVYVEWDINHYITDWAVKQYKPYEGVIGTKMVRAT